MSGSYPNCYHPSSGYPLNVNNHHLVNSLQNYYQEQSQRVPPWGFKNSSPLNPHHVPQPSHHPSTLPGIVPNPSPPPPPPPPPPPSSWTKNNESKTWLEIMKEFPPAKRGKLVFVISRLKRQDRSKPWGLSFGMYDDRIILGDVQGKVRKYIDWSFVTFGKDNVPDAKQIYNPVTHSLAGVSREAYNQKLKVYAKSIASSTNNSNKHNQILPGDMILSLDGYNPRNFATLADFTTHLRNLLQFSIVLVRQPDITTAAMAFSDPSFMPVPPPDAPFRAAITADTIWRRVLDTDVKTFRPAVAESMMVRTPVTSNTILLPPATTKVQRSNPIKVSTTKKSVIGNYKPSKKGRPMSQEMKSVPIKLLNPLELLCQVAVASCEVSSTSIQSYDWARILQVMNAKTLVRPNNVKSITTKHAVNNHNNNHSNNIAGKQAPIPDSWRNCWFKEEEDGQSKNVPFVDNWEFSPEEGTRDKLFLPPIDDFQSWLKQRKDGWKSRYKVYKLASSDECAEEDWESKVRTVSEDFWTHQGFSSFEEWMSTSLSKWKHSYTWNQRKRERIQQDLCEGNVHISDDKSMFRHWLQIRRIQWRLLRRKRKRVRQESEMGQSGGPPSPSSADGKIINVDSSAACAEIENAHLCNKKRRVLILPESSDIACIDDILEEEERQRRVLEDRPPIDISFLFDSDKGAPDDVVVHCFEFLEPQEHSKLLCINKQTSANLKARDNIWRQLCPSRWILPRRPRKPWHELYFTTLQKEQSDCQKRWDDLLLKCSVVLSKGDHLQKFEKLVLKGEADFGFHVNYVSSVVCERNSLLNLGVINRRHKIVRWLVDEKGADIESYDRGHFTPLLNAAWAGDKQLVRLFLQRGADRAKIGFGHYSQPLARPEFRGLTAEGWAKKKGHDEIAELIRLGL